jgi:hypothetical protein
MARQTLNVFRFAVILPPLDAVFGLLDTCYDGFRKK